MMFHCVSKFRFSKKIQKIYFGLVQIQKKSKKSKKIQKKLYPSLRVYNYASGCCRWKENKPVQILLHLKHSKEACGRRKAKQSKRTVFNDGVLIHVGQNKSSCAKLFATRDRVYRQARDARAF
jgi:hypothetical protein